MTTYKVGDILVPKNQVPFLNRQDSYAVLMSSSLETGTIYWWVKVCRKDATAPFWYTVEESNLNRWWVPKPEEFEIGKTYAIKLPSGNMGPSRHYVEDIYSTGDKDYDQYAVFRVTRPDETQCMAIKDFSQRDRYLEVKE